jgi:hypothetical protein
MPPKPGSAIKAYKRRAIAERRVGVDAKCAYCPEARPEALIAGSKPIICAECDRKRKGQSTDDNHHPAGVANSPVTIPIPANDHRAILSVAQYGWPKETLENPSGDPALKIAASIRGPIETGRYLIDEQCRLIDEQFSLVDKQRGLIQKQRQLFEQNLAACFRDA